VLREPYSAEESISNADLPVSRTAMIKMSSI
jgi:hypothetical protein